MSNSKSFKNKEKNETLLMSNLASLKYEVKNWTLQCLIQNHLKIKKKMRHCLR